MCSEEAMKQEVPTLSLLGTVHTVQPENPYTIDDDVQLVCKYLQAYDDPRGRGRRIDRLYRERDGQIIIQNSMHTCTARAS